MKNKLEYILSFIADTQKASAKINRLEAETLDVKNAVIKVTKAFSDSVNKINKKLDAIHLRSTIDNIQSLAQGFESLADPGTKLNSSLSDLNAISEVTPEQLNAIENAARKNAKTFGGDAAQGVESYKLLLSQLTPELAKAPKALEGMGVHVSTLSKTMGNDTTAAAEVLTTAMNQYQVSTKDPIKASEEMGRMMNIMAAAAREGSAELPQQKAALEQSGMAAKAARLEFQEHAAAIQVLDKAGKKGAEGGVALRNVLSILSTGRFLPKDVQKELQTAGVDINQLADNSISFTDRLKPLNKIMGDSALLTKLFGRENKNAALALISGISEQERLSKAVVGTNTAYEQAAIIMESQAEKNARLQAQVDDFKISLFNITGGAIGYAKALGGIAFDISNLLPLFSGLGKVISFVTNMQKLQSLWTTILIVKTKIWTAVQWGLNAALSPIILIPAIIIAIGAAIAWVVSKTEGWSEAWEHTVNGAKLLFQAWVESIKLQFSLAVNGLMIGINKIKKGWYEFKEAVGLGNSEENRKIISEIEANTDSRKKAIIDQAKKVAEVAKKSRDAFSKAAGSIRWKSDKETADGSQASSGIKAPSIPGMGQNTSFGGSNTNKNTNTKTNKAIATGGTKHNYITLNITKEMIGQVHIQGRDFKDSAKQMEEKLIDQLLRVLALATTAGN